MAQRRLLRLRPERQDHVWAYDFVAIRTRDGNRFVFKDDRSLPGASSNNSGSFVFLLSTSRHFDRGYAFP